MGHLPKSLAALSVLLFLSGSPVWACGADGERACCSGCGELSNNGTACDSGTYQVLTGTQLQCGGTPFCALLTTQYRCYAPTPCGGLGQRACCANEQIPACGPGLAESPGCSSTLHECLCAGGAFTSSVCQVGIPPETQNLTLAADRVTISWAAPTYATQYDLLRGLVPRQVGSPGEICFANLSAPTVNDAEMPQPGSGFWYLSRAENSVGTGPWGWRSDGNPRSSFMCP